MELGQVSRRVVPTLWGFATLAVVEHPALLTEVRVDTVLAPGLTPQEFAVFHRHVREGDVLCRRRSGWGDDRVARKVRLALRGGVDVSTSRASVGQGHPGDVGEVALGALVRTVKTVDEVQLATWVQPLARELLWCALTAARTGDYDGVLEGVLALRSLADREQVRGV